MIITIQPRFQNFEGELIINHSVPSMDAEIRIDYQSTQQGIHLANELIRSGNHLLSILKEQK